MDGHPADTHSVLLTASPRKIWKLLSLFVPKMLVLWDLLGTALSWINIDCSVIANNTFFFPLFPITIATYVIKKQHK